jgi:hypothetical protein
MSIINSTHERRSCFELQVQHLLGGDGFHLPCQENCLSLDAAGGDLGDQDGLVHYKQLCCLSLAKTGLERLLFGVRYQPLLCSVFASTHPAEAHQNGL